MSAAAECIARSAGLGRYDSWTATCRAAAASVTHWAWTDGSQTGASCPIRSARRTRPGHSSPSLHHASCYQAARHRVEVGTCQMDRALHGPDPALHAALFSDGKGWLETVTQVVPHQAAGRSRQVTILHDTSVNTHMARNHDGPHAPVAYRMPD